MKHLNKSLLAAAALAATTATPVALAQSSVSVYGLIDMSAGQYQLAGQQKKWVADSGNLSTSFLGFSGKEDLGGGLAATFALESFLQADSGRQARVTGSGADVFWARNANVGLANNTLGSVRLGRVGTPFFVSTLLFNPFGDSFGFSPSIRQYYGDRGSLVGDSGWSNAIAYSTPSFNGFSANLAGNLGEGSTNARGKNWGGNVLYFGGPFAAALSYQDVKNSADTRFSATPLGGSFQAQKSVQFGASYNFGMAKLFGQYGEVKTERTTASYKHKIAQVGVSVPVGPGAVLASYGQEKFGGDAFSFPPFSTLNAKSKIATVGYDYNLSKRTDAYAIYMNDKLTGSTNGNSFMVGLRHKF